MGVYGEKSELTSTGTKMTLSPNSLATWCPCEELRSQSTTFDPDRANRSTVAFPSPLAPPVTKLTQFCYVIELSGYYGITVQSDKRLKYLEHCWM